jgi:hypothetical protein
MRWATDWERVRAEFDRAPFVTIDPGTHGAGAICPEPFKFAELFRLSQWTPWRIARAMKEHGAKLLVIEDQYLGKSVKTSLTIGYRKGLLLGALSAYMPELVVVHVRPSEWQNGVLVGCKGRDDLAKGAKNVAEKLLERAGIEIPKWSKADLTGLHDAVCMAEWFTWNTQHTMEGG